MKIYRTLLVLLCVLTPCLSNAQAINQSNADGLKEGRWIVKYDNGRTRYEGFFDAGRPVGKMKKYYSTGIMCAELIYSLDSDTIQAKLYDKKAIIIASGAYADTKKVGRWQYFKDGILAYKQDYSNDTKNGQRIVYFKDGTIFETSDWVNGSLCGKYQTFFPGSGQVSFETYTQNGVYSGDAVSYYENGNPESKGSYKNGKQEGKWDYFNYDGKHLYTLEFINGVMQVNEIYDSIQTREINKLLQRVNDKRPDPEDFIADPHRYIEKAAQ